MRYYYFHVQIKRNEYLSSDAANKLVIDIASKEIVNLDSYSNAVISDLILLQFAMKQMKTATLFLLR